MKLIDLIESSAESIQHELAMWNKYVWDLMDSDLIFPNDAPRLRGWVKVGQMYGPEDFPTNVFVEDKPENEQLISKLQRGFQREQKLQKQLNQIQSEVGK